MRACISSTAKAAEFCCVRSRATAVYSVRTALTNARRYSWRRRAVSLRSLMDAELLICIAVLHVPPGVTFAVQRGRHELLQPSRSKGGSLIFDLSVRVSERKGGGPPNVLGPYTQGKPDDRFIYLNSGTMAGQRDSCFTRRAKIKTDGITWNLVKQALANAAVLETQVEGKARDGGPCCATVSLLDGWKVSHA
jgi:hypothetical protein